MKNFMLANKILLTIIMAAILCACNSGGSSNTNSNTPNKNDHLIDPVAKGNGVWDYSVATDYYHGTQIPTESPSLKYDLKVTFATSVVQFVFPVFSTLDAPNGVISVSNSDYVTVCPNNEKPSSTQMLNYYALPQLNDSYLATGNILGSCVNGESATTYYSGFVSHVVPVIELTQQFESALGQASTDTVLAVADNVASVINSDPNTYGVAFDNEPLLSKAGGNSTTPAGIILEQTFYGEIAYKLAESKKYLFLYDAQNTAIYLESAGFRHTNLNNIVISQYLYDLDTTSDAYPAGPVSVESYTTLVDNETTKDLANNLSSYPPLRFMLPASATSTMWDYLQGYNMLATEMSYTAPTTLTDKSTCQTEDALTSSSVDNLALTAFLCSPSNPVKANPPNGLCLGDPGFNAESVISGFLNTQNCVNYTNSEHMLQYFAASLTSITNSNAFNNKRYMGADLYAWRISAYSDINGSKGYFNQNDYPAYVLSTQIFPAAIGHVIWESFITWALDNE